MKRALLGCLCLLLLTSPGAARPGATRPTAAVSDARLKQMVQAFGSGDQEASIFRIINRSELLPRLERLQREASPTSVLHRRLTFTLAYFGQEYQANVRRLMIPVRLWEKQDDRSSAYEDSGFELLVEVPAMLVRLYEHNRDPSLLRILFDMGLDGGPAEGLSVRKVQLITRHPLRVLQALQHSPGLTENALCALATEVGADEEEYRRAVANIRRASRGADPRLRRYIQRFLRQLDARRRAFDYDRPGRSLRGADLEGAWLAGTALAGVDLRGANLRNADLQYTDLRGARLQGADLRGAQYNSKTHWPAGFDPKKAGAILIRPSSGP
jgi:hypothetical protein